MSHVRAHKESVTLSERTTAMEKSPRLQTVGEKITSDRNAGNCSTRTQSILPRRLAVEAAIRQTG